MLTPANLSRLGLWPLRVGWVLLPILAGPGLLAAADGASNGVSAVVEVGLWLAWFVGLVSALAPSAISLTAVRIIAPAAPLATVALAFIWGGWSASAVAAVAVGVLLTVIALLPTTGDLMVNGSAYGSERRMALKPPAAAVMGPIPVAWLMVFFGATVGPLLLAAQRYWLAVPALALGAPAVILGARSLHQLALRWVVFVPAGFVLHDYLMLAESILFQRREKPSLGPAPAPSADSPDSDTIDLSGKAIGLALLAALPEEVPVAIRRGPLTTQTSSDGSGAENAGSRPPRGQIDATSASRFVFTPSLPDQVLQEARARAITIT